MVIKLTEDKIQLIRKLKTEGKSLSEIQKETGIAQSTISLHCRDLYTHPLRVYRTEEEARTAKRKHDKGKHINKKNFQCIKCGKPVRYKNKLCVVCHNQKRKEDAIIRRNTKEKSQSIQQQKYLERLEDTKQRRAKYIKQIQPIVIDICDKSPNQRHHWNLSSDNVGRCKYCGEVKDFNTDKVFFK